MGGRQVHSQGLIQMPATLEQLLQQLGELKTQFDPISARRVEQVIARLSRCKVDDSESVIRLHELLLFVRAYPHNKTVLRLAESELRTYSARVKRLIESEVELSGLLHPEVSGIAGTEVIDTFTYPIVKWLNDSRPNQIDVYWDWFEEENRLADIWPTFIPLLAEDALVEAHIPYREWMRKARGQQSEVQWLLNRFNQLEGAEERKSQLYNAQQLYVRWRFNYRDSRTGHRLPTKKCFIHDGPLIQRREISLAAELSKPALKLQRLSAVEGQRAIDLARTASTVRYRELYGFTHGDPRSVCRADLGRGVELQIITLPPNKRLPLRAYHSAMIFKNGVAIGYFEGLSLFERMESGFNLYYTFRDGETAWLYAQVLSVMRQLTGVTAFTLDPYQIGFENEEGIESGAFWFYRKLSFRSTSRSIRELTAKEETKLTTRKGYRTSAATLRKLAEAPMILELDKSREGDWDRFQVRNVGLAVQRLMAEKFDGDAKRMHSSALTNFAHTFELDESDMEDNSFIAFATILLLVPQIKNWSKGERAQMVQIVRTKREGDEGKYLRLMQRHLKLREAMIQVGSKQPSAR